MPAYGEPTPSIGGLNFEHRQLRGNAPGQGARAGRLGRVSARSRPSQRRKNGDAKQLGIGLSTYCRDVNGLAPSRVLGSLRYAAGGWDATTSPHPCDRRGRGLRLAVTPHGQGHGTTFAQIVADDLGRADRGRRRSSPANKPTWCRGAWTRTSSREPYLGSAAWPRTGPPRRSSQKASEIAAPPSWRSPRRTWSIRTGTFSVKKALANQAESRYSAGILGMDGAQPARRDGAGAGRRVSALRTPRTS